MAACPRSAWSRAALWSSAQCLVTELFLSRLELPGGCIRLAAPRGMGLGETEVVGIGAVLSIAPEAGTHPLCLTCPVFTWTPLSQRFKCVLWTQQVIVGSTVGRRDHETGGGGSCRVKVP